MTGHLEIQEDLPFDQMAKGDHEAFSTIFNHYYSRIYTFFLRKSKDTESAKELIQDLFLKAWKYRERFAGHPDPESYLFRMAVNLTIDHLRKMVSRFRLLQAAGQALPPAANEGADVEVAWKETAAVVRDMVQQLPSQRRKIYRLHLEGYTNRQIADRLTLSRNTIKNQLGTASRYIQTSLIKRGIHLLPLFPLLGKIFL